MRCDAAKPAAAKSRLRRLFERQLPGAVKIVPAEQLADGEIQRNNGGEMDPSSLCLAKMVQSFMEEGNEMPSRCGLRRCNCFSSSCGSNSEDEHDIDASDRFVGDTADALNGLIPCSSAAERNLLAEASRIMEKIGRIGKGRGGDDGCRRRWIHDELRGLGYDASICKSSWKKTPSIPAGEHEYVDVVVEGGERLLVELNFRSEFEIARPTKAYRAALQSVPVVFVGSADRLRRIVAVVSEAARLSLGKKGLLFPPWRSPEYMSSKWLSPCRRSVAGRSSDDLLLDAAASSPGMGKPVFEEVVVAADADETAGVVVVPPWQPPALKPKTSPANSKVVTGLACVFGEAN